LELETLNLELETWNLKLGTWNYIQSDFADDTVFQKMQYPMSPRPCRGGARGGVSDIKDRDVKS